MNVDCPNCGSQDAYFDGYCYTCPECDYDWEDDDCVADWEDDCDF